MKRLLAALAVLTVVISPVHAQTQPLEEPEADVLMAEPRELSAGGQTTVSGSGCAPGNNVSFVLSDPNPGSSVEGVAQGDGSFAQTVALPSTTRVGRVWLRATCLTPASKSKVMEAVLLVRRPEFVITWTNVIFGMGTALTTAGIGLAMLKQSHSSKRHSGRGRKHKRRSGGRKSRRRRPGPRIIHRSPRVPQP